MRSVRIHFLDLSRVDPQGFGAGRVQRELVEQKRVKRERAEQKRTSHERVEQERAKQERAEQEFLFRRLEPVDTGYHHNLCCMSSIRSWTG